MDARLTGSSTASASAVGAGATVTVVGGGIGGLVAAIRCAELGGSVTLHEAHDRLGGRARSTDAPYVANLGPHAVYADGSLWRFLAARGMTPPVAGPPPTGMRFRYRGRARRRPPAALLRSYRGMRSTGRPAPVDVPFRRWAAGRWGEDDAAVLCGAAGVFTFHHDPGALSAAFVAERFRRVFALPSQVRYVRGGWATLVATLQRRARELGVRIATSSKVDALPDPPVIIATELRSAGRLLGDPRLTWPSGSVALLDVGLRRRRSDPWVVCDVDDGAWVERFSRTDATLAPAGCELLQAQIGLRPGESTEAALGRLHGVLDAAFPGWRTRQTWARHSRASGRTGALDLPGTTWRDRPAIDRGGGVFLATDMSRAPGLLSEVTVTSALHAAQAALKVAEVAGVRR